MPPASFTGADEPGSVHPSMQPSSNPTHWYWQENSDTLQLEEIEFSPEQDSIFSPDLQPEYSVFTGIDLPQIPETSSISAEDERFKEIGQQETQGDPPDKTTYQIVPFTCSDMHYFLREPLSEPELQKTPLIVEEMTTSFYQSHRNRSNELPGGWNEVIHPHGYIYFWNESFRTIICADLYDPRIQRCLPDVMAEVHPYLWHTNSALLATVKDDLFYTPPDFQLILALQSLEESPLIFKYYLATLEGRCLFWKHQHDLSETISSYSRVTLPNSTFHIRHFMEAEYWLHYETFPNVQQVSVDIIEEAKSFLVYAAMDMRINLITPVELSAEEIDQCLSIAKDVKPSNGLESSGYGAWCVGILMRVTALHRFHNFHGEKNARWRRDHLLYDTDEIKEPRSMFIVSSFLFFTPNRYLFSLKNILAGDFVFYSAWKRFVQELHLEWSNLTVIATVILATNVGFLAIPVVDNGNDHAVNRSAQQVLSYLSTITSIGSILVAQVLARYHRIKGLENLDERIPANLHFLTRLGSNTLSIVYSIPYALLTWGMLTFLAAFLIMCFKGTDNAARSVIGGVSAVIAIIIMLCALVASEDDEDVKRRNRLMEELFGRPKKLVQALTKCVSSRPFRRSSQLDGAIQHETLSRENSV
ncbi:hypothetical protein M422DRAFT_242451 [Sphaerobolus stellatus SS14]|nr:hypothetical protein M422DRAFT_242451 [Sphaerobolus stellatus SS14]